MALGSTPASSRAGCITVATVPAFLGAAGYGELCAHPDALKMIRADRHRLGWPTDQTDQMLRRMDRTGEPTAYLFRCLPCRGVGTGGTRLRSSA